MLENLEYSQKFVQIKRNYYYKILCKSQPMFLRVVIQCTITCLVDKKCVAYIILLLLKYLKKIVLLLFDILQSKDIFMEILQIKEYIYKHTYISILKVEE